jgi:hypothetical protein
MWFFGPTDPTQAGDSTRSIPGSASRSCLLELIPSFTKTFRKCHSTVRRLIKSLSAISVFV